MAEFLEDNLVLLVGVAIVIIPVVIVALALMKAKRIDRDGIETDAVVTRVEENVDPDSAGSSYSTYVEYEDENGERRESYMALSVYPEYAVGQKLRIKYVPGVHDLVRDARAR